MTGLAYSYFDSGVYDKEIFDTVHTIPFPSAEIDSYSARLLGVLEKGKIDIFIPMV